MKNIFFNDIRDFSYPKGYQLQLLQISEVLLYFILFYSNSEVIFFYAERNLDKFTYFRKESVKYKISSAIKR